MGGDGRVEGGRRDMGGGEGGGPQGGHYPPSPSLSLSTGAGIFLMSRDAPPLAEGQRGFPLERREIVASLGQMAGIIRESGSLLSLHWGIAPHGLR